MLVHAGWPRREDLSEDGPPGLRHHDVKAAAVCRVVFWG